MLQNFKNRWDSIIHKISNYLLAKSFKAAKIACSKSNKKMFVVLINGEYVAISKMEFKILWQRTPAMKKLTIQEWQYRIYEFKK